MTPRPSSRRKREAPSPFPEPGLAELGLAPGDAVRFRRRESERWVSATVARREKDGSIGLHDGKGAARSIAVELIECRATGPRGGVVWEPLTERAARTEQLPLVRTPAAPRPTRRAAEAPADPVDDRDGDDAGGDDQPDDGDQLRLL